MKLFDDFLVYTKEAEALEAVECSLNRMKI